MSEWNFVWAAYALTWATLVGYAWYVQRKVREGERGLVEPLEPFARYSPEDDRGPGLTGGPGEVTR